MLMSFFDAPIEFCSVQHKFVLLDQTQSACARSERCEKPGYCPLGRFFRRPGATTARKRSVHERGWE